MWYNYSVLMCALPHRKERYDIMFENLVKKVKSAASDAAEHEYSLNIGGMKCENCARKVTELLTKIPGIEKAVASVKDGKIDIVSSLPVVKEAVEKVVKEAGFDFKGLIEKK